MAVSAAIAAVVVAGAGVAVSAKQGSIANKRAKKAQAAQAQQAADQTAALEALEAESTLAMADAEGTKRQRRRSIARQLGRGGRQSTILTGPGGQAGLGG